MNTKLAENLENIVLDLGETYQYQKSLNFNTLPEAEIMAMVRALLKDDRIKSDNNKYRILGMVIPNELGEEIIKKIHIALEDYAVRRISLEQLQSGIGALYVSAIFDYARRYVISDLRSHCDSKW